MRIYKIAHAMFDSGVISENIFNLIMSKLLSGKELKFTDNSNISIVDGKLPSKKGTIFIGSIDTKNAIGNALKQSNISVNQELAKKLSVIYVALDLAELTDKSTNASYGTRKDSNGNLYSIVRMSLKPGVSIKNMQSIRARLVSEIEHEIQHAFQTVVRNEKSKGKEYTEMDRLRKQLRQQKIEQFVRGKGAEHSIPTTKQEEHEEYEEYENDEQDENEQILRTKNQYNKIYFNLWQEIQARAAYVATVQSNKLREIITDHIVQKRHNVDKIVEQLKEFSETGQASSLIIKSYTREIILELTNFLSNKNVKQKTKNDILHASIRSFRKLVGKFADELKDEYSVKNGQNLMSYQEMVNEAIGLSNIFAEIQRSPPVGSYATTPTGRSSFPFINGLFAKFKITYQAARQATTDKEKTQTMNKANSLINEIRSEVSKLKMPIFMEDQAVKPGSKVAIFKLKEQLRKQAQVKNDLNDLVAKLNEDREKVKELHLESQRMAIISDPLKKWDGSDWETINADKEKARAEYQRIELELKKAEDNLYNTSVLLNSKINPTKTEMKGLDGWSGWGSTLSIKKSYLGEEIKPEYQEMVKGFRSIVDRSPKFIGTAYCGMANPPKTTLNHLTVVGNEYILPIPYSASKVDGVAAGYVFRLSSPTTPEIQYSLFLTIECQTATDLSWYAGNKEQYIHLQEILLLPNTRYVVTDVEGPIDQEIEQGHTSRGKYFYWKVKLKEIGNSDIVAPNHTNFDINLMSSTKQAQFEEDDTEDYLIELQQQVQEDEEQRELERKRGRERERKRELEKAEASCNFEYDDNDEITIIKYKGSGRSGGSGGNVSIPSSIDNKTVFKIGEKAFAECPNLITVTIPDSVTIIGSGAFTQCSSMMAVTIGNRVNTIESQAFSLCNRLVNIAIPDSVTKIGINAFVDCRNLKTVTIGSGLTDLGMNAFNSCYNLSDVYFSGDAPLETGENVFYMSKKVVVHYRQGTAGWKKLFCWRPTKMVEGDAEITSNISKGIQKKAQFEEEDFDIDELQQEVQEDQEQEERERGIRIEREREREKENEYLRNFEHIGNTIVKYVGTEREIIIPSSMDGRAISKIGDKAFYNHSELINITIPNSVTNIGQRAFSDCTSLINITIPDSVTTIAEDAFFNCEDLTTVTIGRGVTGVARGAFAGCKSLTSVYFEGDAPEFLDQTAFYCSKNVTVYCQPRTGGWGKISAGRPTKILEDNSLSITGLNQTLFVPPFYPQIFETQAPRNNTGQAVGHSQWVNIDTISTSDNDDETIRRAIDVAWNKIIDYERVHNLPTRRGLIRVIDSNGVLVPEPEIQTLVRGTTYEWTRRSQSSDPDHGTFLGTVSNLPQEASSSLVFEDIDGTEFRIPWNDIAYISSV